MGHTNSTVNYNLPQFIGTDKPSWLGDINNAFSAIDTAIANAASTATTADGKADALGTTVSGHTTQIGTLSNTVTAQGNTLNTVTALIGNGTPTTTDQTIIGAINELNARNKYEVLGTANANQTFATQIGQLKAVFDTLTDEQKLHSALKRGDDLYYITQLSLGRYQQSRTGADTLLETVLVMNDSKNYTCSITSGGTTFRDNSADTNTSSLELIKF